MNAQKVQIGTSEYLKIELEEVVQKGQSFYLAKIKASDFIKVYTVRPAEYDLEKHSSLAQSFPEEAEYYDHLIKEDKNKINDKDFQREADSSRISSVVKYLEDEEFAFFPNTIIASCELINDWEEYNIDEDSDENAFFNIQQKPNFLSFFHKVDGAPILYVPFLEKSILVIDGQHRLEGLRRTESAFLDNYDLVLAFIIGYDRSVIAKQFYTINYEQKPVNKSLLYQLTGEFTREVNEISFMHNIVKLLNELSESPFYGRVKMLGKTPKRLSAEAKRKLSISQAFLIDAMIRFISPRAKGTLYPPIFLKYYLNQKDHIKIVRAIARYFNAVKKTKNDWETPETSLLSKGMGVAALLKVFNLMFPIIFERELKNDWDRIEELTIERYQQFLRGLENVNFASNGPYGKTGSEGSITKITRDIVSNLEYLGRPSDVKAFEQELRRTTNANLENFLPAKSSTNLQ